MSIQTENKKPLSPAVATARLFGKKGEGWTPMAASEALIAFYQAIQDADDPDGGSFYRSVQREAILPIAQTVAQVICAEMADRVIACGASKKTRDRFGALSAAFVGIARTLDRDAADENAPAYHNRSHNLLVMATRLVRGLAAMNGAPLRSAVFVDEMRDLIAALGHDLGHDGTNNRADGSYVPFRLEQKAYDTIRPSLIAAGVGARDQEAIRTQILATDPDLPGDIVGYAHALHFGAGTSALTRGALAEKIRAMGPEGAGLQSLMEKLEKDADLTMAAAALKGADMTPSFGLGPQMWQEQSRLFHAESMRLAPDRPVLDDKGMPRPMGQLFVMLNFVGAEMCARVQPRNGAGSFLLARFIDPVMDRLFGGSLRALQERCTGEAGTAAAGMTTAYAQKYGLNLG